MTKNDLAMMEELARNLDRFAKDGVREKVMAGSEKITASTSKDKIAKWLKGAMDRLDSLVDEKTRNQVMENCGYSCADHNKKLIGRMTAKRKKFKSVDEFLEAEQRKPMRGTKLIREGDVLYYFYTPSTFSKSLRCYCGLLRGLPASEKVSSTYCHCSKGFVEKFWEGVLGRPVNVELVQSAVSGSQECKFAIRL